MKFKVLLASVICGCGGMEPPQGPPPLHGEGLHFKAWGHVAGKDFDFIFEGPLAEDKVLLKALRKYCVPDGLDKTTWGEAHVYCLEINVEYEGVRGMFRSENGSPVLGEDGNQFLKNIEIDFKYHDFQASEIGDTIEIRPRHEAITGPSTSMLLEIEKSDQNISRYFFEQDVLHGKVRIDEWSGDLGDGAVITHDAGRVGGTFEAWFSGTEWIKASFMVLGESRPKQTNAQDGTCSE